MRLLAGDRKRPGQRAAGQLVLVGAMGWGYQAIYDEVARLDLVDHVHFAGFVPAAELPDWYRAATLFVYPSLLEGFGLPVLEAMACGTPVICGRSPGVREIAGEAAVTVDAEDEDELVAALASVMASTELRDELRVKGEIQVEKFSWQTAAKQTLSLYEQTIG